MDEMTLPLEVCINEQESFSKSGMLRSHDVRGHGSLHLYKPQKKKRGGGGDCHFVKPQGRLV